ncbi:MAG: hypothetical protein ACKN8Y_00930, partial [Polynucleobacter victoriensis]
VPGAIVAACDQASWLANVVIAAMSNFFMTLPDKQRYKLCISVMDDVSWASQLSDKLLITGYF